LFELDEKQEKISRKTLTEFTMERSTWELRTIAGKPRWSFSSNKMITKEHTWGRSHQRRQCGGIVVLGDGMGKASLRTAFGSNNNWSNRTTSVLDAMAMDKGRHISWKRYTTVRQLGGRGRDE
jgi:hypothetical protein